MDWTTFADELYTILQLTPAMTEKGNRSVLLRNLPKGPAGYISRENALNADLHAIVDGAAGMGELDTGEHALLVVAENTLSFVQGLALGTRLEELIEQATSSDTADAQAATEAAPTLPGMLPSGSRMPYQRNPNFEGRQESLEQLAQLLTNPEHPTVITQAQAITGMGGIGKSQLAVEFAYQYGYTLHGVHWVDAANPSGIDTEIAACGELMRLSPWPTKQAEQVERTLKAWSDGKSRLVILDNLEDDATLREWLRRKKKMPAVILLVTSRRSEYPHNLALTQLSLETFSPPESLRFLKGYRPKANEKDLMTLAELLGHLPLALNLAGEYLEDDPGLSVAAYCEAISDNRSFLDHESARGWAVDVANPTECELNLRASFDMSWQRVTDTNAQTLFKLLGWCAPNAPVPLDVLATALKDMEIPDIRRAQNILEKHALLKTGKGYEPILHPLVAAFAQDLDAEQTQLAVLCKSVAPQAKDVMEDRIPANFAPLLPHVLQLAQHAENHRQPQAGALYDALGRYYFYIAAYQEAKATFEHSVMLNEANYGPQSPQVAESINDLGLVLKTVGNLGKAQVAFEQALRIDEAVYGPEHPNVARDINNRGLVLNDLGDLGGARKAFERALRINEALYGPEHPDVTGSINNLGLVLKDLGDLSGAREALERALRIAEEIYGPEHPNVATTVNNLGSVLQDLGDLGGAREAFERALSITEQTFGTDHPQVAGCLNNLGYVLHAQGNLRRAKALYQRALRIYLKFLPRNHPDIKMVRQNINIVTNQMRRGFR